MTPAGRPGIDAAAFRSILLLRPRRIGDIVLTTPAVRALRRALPGARLVYYVESPYAALVRNHPDLDAVIAVDRGQGPIAFLETVGRVRRERFDAVVDFHGGPRPSRLAWLSRARVKAGYDIPGRRFIYDVRVPRSGPAGAPLHSAANHLNLVRALGIAVEDTPPLVLPEPAADDRAGVDRFLADSGFDAPGTRLVVLHVGAGNRFRDWGRENLERTAAGLASRPGVRVALLGGAEDRERAEAIAAAAGAGVASAAGRLGLLAARDLIARARLYVGPDSGPMHVAASTATPIVAVFGPTLPAHFAPWRPENVRVVERPLPCRPCPQRECATGDRRCLGGIAPADVLAGCGEFL